MKMRRDFHDPSVFERGKENRVMPQSLLKQRLYILRVNWHAIRAEGPCGSDFLAAILEVNKPEEYWEVEYSFQPGSNGATEEAGSIVSNDGFIVFNPEQAEPIIFGYFIGTAISNGGGISQSEQVPQKVGV